jgi:dolichol kinase
MFLGGVILSLLVLWVFALAGVFIVDWSLFLPRILLLGVLATLVESLPLRDLDNLTVPVVTVLAGLFLV